MSDSAEQLRAAIEKPIDDELQFQCDLCEQHYYDSDDVDSESVFFGEAPAPRKVRAEAIEPKADRTQGLNRTGQLQVLGKPADEIQALIVALEGSDRFEFKTARRVCEPQFEAELPQDPADIPAPDFDEQFNEDVVGAMVTAEPRPSRAQPAAEVCEYCVEMIKHE